MNNDTFISRIAKEQNITDNQVQAVASLLLEGATIPFIARYRKEATGSLDEVAVMSVRDRLNQLRELEERKETVLKSLEKHGHMTDELQEKVVAAESMTVLEDIYLPYKPKRRTRAVIAKEKGLEPLALMIFEQKGTNPGKEAKSFIDPEKGVESVEDALAGARDIIAEIINENDKARARLRNLFFTKAAIKSRVASGMEEKGAKFRDYFDWEELVAGIPSHRMLAMRRGESEAFLNLDILPDEEEATAILENLFVNGEGDDSAQVKLAVKDCYKRLLSRSMETETRLHAKERAEIEAIKVFADNLRQLLLAPPLGAKRVMGIDPGFRTGCKLVCLDQQGKLLHYDTVYPHMSEKKALAEAEKIKSLCEKFDIEVIAVGNGTAGRETEAFVKAVLFSKPVQVIMVNESGASIYSASETAREEFPDHDLTVRGAVSIGRRLMDPLAELVKIDPKSIGVGQYQHDVDQKALKQTLDDVVMSCVNGVGVDLNRASAQLLTYVSGLNAGIAKNIIAYREENGPFKSRRQLTKVSRLGPKAFEQSAGFLRILDGENPLDASAVHPESYYIVDAITKDLGTTVVAILKKPDIRQQIDVTKYVTESVGIPTLNDILNELAKPGRDPREKFEAFAFADGIEKIEDLRPGMKIPGIVTNITAFGAFVDIGVHQDGLVHVSQMADRFVKNPADIVKNQQKVMVTVLEVDLARNRISLSMKSQAEKSGTAVENHNPKPKNKNKKNLSSGNAPFNNPLAEALIKSGLK
ncbi:MAG: RNA-binding transcriptional accessory protein [Proteobacteria bacterium]|nr:RNA-binding transcriptional accessory protein [Desulfobacteraceae bacterium]MBU3980558.1 RNA-binding transcriptional accessory protein [Pseudomonadota bacterium]MBU4013844.1 RNA-binding transcriptional accessory protein [Pseudomonadota bacterium]